MCRCLLSPSHDALSLTRSFIYVMLHSLLTPAGKVAAREILQEAAATLH